MGIYWVDLLVPLSLGLIHACHNGGWDRGAH